MSHNITNGKFAYNRAVGPAWHKIGTPIAEGSTALEGVRAARADFLVGKTPVWYQQMDEAGELVFHPDGSPVLVPSRETMLTLALPGPSIGNRTRELGRVGTRYSILQNAVAAGLLDKVQDVIWQTCGVLDRNKAFFVSGRLAPAAIRRAYGAEEPLERFLTLANWHDGFKRARVYLSGILTVCENTLMAGIGAADDMVALRHIGDIEKAMEAAVDAVGLAVDGFDAAIERWERLDHVLVQAPAADEYFAEIAKQATYKATAKRIDDLVTEMRGLFHTGAGNHGETAYDALQAVTDWVSHKRSVGRRAKTEHDRNLKQADDMLLGQGRGLLRRADKLAMTRWGTIEKA